MYITEEPSLRDLEPQLRPPFVFQMGDQTLAEVKPCQGGPGYFQDQIENLTDNSSNWMLYTVYYDDILWMYYTHQNVYFF
jgi:hypothetical protein